MERCSRPSVRGTTGKGASMMSSTGWSRVSGSLMRRSIITLSVRLPTSSSFRITGICEIPRSAMIPITEPRVSSGVAYASSSLPFRAPRTRSTVTSGMLDIKPWLRIQLSLYVFERYRYPESGRSNTNTSSAESSPAWASIHDSAPASAMPEDCPQNRPSSAASRRVIRIASRSVTCTKSSGKSKSIFAASMSSPTPSVR